MYIDLSQYDIYVILDDGYYEYPSPGVPFDVEGKVLSMEIHSENTIKYYNQGKTLEFICDPDYLDFAIVEVRWSNDTKGMYPSGTMQLRRAKMSFCRSIWMPYDTHLMLDHRPHTELKPRTVTVENPYHTYTNNNPAIIGKEIKWEAATIDIPKQAEIREAVYADPHQMPWDGEWYKCMYQGVLGRAKKDIHADMILFHEEMDETHITTIPINTIPPPSNPFAEVRVANVEPEEAPQMVHYYYSGNSDGDIPY